jgi:lysozyme
MRRLPAVLLLLGALAARAFVSESEGPHPDVAALERNFVPFAGHSVCAAGTTIEGIDVSHWDGTIDWTKVAGSGRKFGIAKATEGTTFVDNTFATHWAAMKQVGIVRGAYHFFRPALDGAQQADWYLATVGAFAKGDLPAVLDWEAIDGIAAADAVAQVQAFVNRVHAKTGQTTIVYTSARVLDQVGDPTQFTALPLWDANWGVTCPSIPTM